MNHLIKYDSFNESRQGRMVLNMGYLLATHLIKKAFNIKANFNFHWKEIKRKTIDPKFDPIISIYSPNSSEIENDLENISLKDIPHNKLKISTFLANGIFI